MNRDELESILITCTGMQGYYGRFYYESYLSASEEAKNGFLEMVNDAGITDIVGFTMWMENGCE